MKLLPAFLHRPLARALIGMAARRPPDRIIGQNDDGSGAVYMRRWYILPRNDWFNVYLHHFLRSDDERGLHDHPYWNASYLLEGEYLEIVPVSRAWPVDQRKTGMLRSAGHLVIRRPTAAHRIQLFTRLCRDDQDVPYRDGEEPAWSLFITGPRVREWGFWCKEGRWVHWKIFTARTDAAPMGRGCG